MSRPGWRPPYGNVPRFKRERYSERRRRQRARTLWLATKLTLLALLVGAIAAAIIGRAS